MPSRQHSTIAWSSSGLPSPSSLGSNHDHKSSISYYTTYDAQKRPLLRSGSPWHRGMTCQGTDLIPREGLEVFRERAAGILNDAYEEHLIDDASKWPLSWVTGEEMGTICQERMQYLNQLAPNLSAIWIDNNTYTDLHVVEDQIAGQLIQDGHIVMARTDKKPRSLSKSINREQIVPQAMFDYEVSNVKIYVNPVLPPTEYAKSRSKLMQVANSIKSRGTRGGWPSSAVAAKIASEFGGCGTLIVEPDTLEQFRAFEEIETAPTGTTATTGPSAASSGSVLGTMTDDRGEKWDAW